MYEELYHHGILGQRWGVRRYQNKDGSLTAEGRMRYGRDTNAHIISKNTKMYRTGIMDNDGLPRDQKHAYVTYTKADRALYSGSYAGKLVQQQSGYKNFDDLVKNKDKVQPYEHEYRLKEDLKVPSKKTVDDILLKLSQDKASLKDIASTQAHAPWMVDYYKYLADDKYYEQLVNSGKDYVKDWNDTEYKKVWHSIERKEGQEYIKNYMKNFHQKSYEDKTIESAQSLGLSTRNKEHVINELKKMGYNAMVDEAGVGRSNNPEGVEPLIIFDRNVLEKVSSTPLTQESITKSDKYYDEWKKKERRKRS